MADITTTGAVAPIPFSFNGHAVRVIQRDGQPWFVATDVCTALGYSNSRAAVADHLDDDERSTVANPDGRNGGGLITIISESGLYALVLRSRKPEARRFAKWVTSEVLPAIRKTGSYAEPAALHPMAYKRMLIRFDHLGRPGMGQILSDDTKVLSCSGMAAAIRSPNAGGWSNEVLLDLAEAIHARLASEVRRMSQRSDNPQSASGVHADRRLPGA